MITFGLLLIATGLGYIKSNPADFGGHDGLNVMIGVGLTLTMLGLHFGFWSAHAYLDKSRDIILYRSGIFGMGKTKKYKLSDFDTIKLNFTEGGDDSADEFIILLTHAESASVSQPLVKGSNRAEALDHLNTLKDFLGWPVNDTSLGPVAHVVEHDVRHDKKPFHTPSNDQLSPTSQLTVTDTRGEMTISYPAPSMIGGQILSACLPFLFALFAFWEALCANPLYFVGFILIWGFVILLAVHKKRTSPDMFTLKINSKELIIPRPRNPRKSMSISLADIQSLSLHVHDETVPSSMRHMANKMTVQTKDDRYDIGWWLSTEDVTHLYHLLKSRT